MEKFNEKSVGKIFKHDGKKYKCLSFASKPSVEMEEVGNENSRISFCVDSPVSRDFEFAIDTRKDWIKRLTDVGTVGCTVVLYPQDCKELAELLKQEK